MFVRVSVCRIFFHFSVFSLVAKFVSFPALYVIQQFLSGHYFCQCLSVCLFVEFFSTFLFSAYLPSLCHFLPFTLYSNSRLVIIFVNVCPCVCLSVCRIFFHFLFLKKLLNLGLKCYIAIPDWPLFLSMFIHSYVFLSIFSTSQ